jgi:uncharacterized Fe-S center protein
MSSEVFFIDFNSHNGNILPKINELFDAAEMNTIIERDEKVAVKLHFGEYGNFRQLRTSFVAQIVKKIKGLNAHPFLTDANCLAGARTDAIEHIITANFNGFNLGSTGAPIIIADGLTGRDYVEVQINGEHYKKVPIASSSFYADSLISLAHFKGDIEGETRYWAGTLKNLGLGLAARHGKASIHMMKPPKVTSKCNNCGECLEWCQSKAIVESNPVVKIIPEKCTMCGNCVAFCPLEAISIEWFKNETLQEKFVEHALGALKDKERKTGFFNFAMEITPVCDCAKWSGIPGLKDIGILASRDPVAVDQATYDLCLEQVGLEPQDALWTTQLKHAEKLGMGKRKYKLINI